MTRGWGTSAPRRRPKGALRIGEAPAQRSKGRRADLEKGVPRRAWEEEQRDGAMPRPGGGGSGNGENGGHHSAATGAGPKTSGRKS